MFRKIITYLTIYSFMFSNVCWAAMITPRRPYPDHG